MASETMEQPAEVASKVLRRAQVSKMTRVLQNRLALANVKVKHGWEALTLDTIEPKVELELKRKRPSSSSGAVSDTSSSTSDRFYSRGLDSSPLAAPIFSDDITRSGSMYGKRGRYQPSLSRQAVSSNHNRVRARVNGRRVTSWKSNYRLPESSPAFPQRQVNFLNAREHRNPSFMSEASTIADDAGSVHSEEDDEDLPTLSSQAPQIRSSPPHAPRTPPPGQSRTGRLRSKPFINAANETTNNNNEEGADLLMFLAASPSPANPRIKHAPSTPPPKSTPLPSSMMTTPGGSGAGFLAGFGAATPGMGFNFSDYLNVTPSPAQAAWRTPALAKTPLAAREARRRLNFDALLPPGVSPSLGNSSSSAGAAGAGGAGVGAVTSSSEAKGLGMELGGELVSSQ